ncbi:MAG: arginine--tRNA ligase [Marinifilaceae bacterium]|nr:arginine--tRNA ligase [Marinifilaceae bacterium]
MTIEGLLTAKVSEAVEACFGVKIEEKDVQLQATRKEFAGDLTVVVFPFTRLSRKSPEETGKILGEYLKEKIEEIKDYNVVKGFLNIEISSAYWVGVLNDIDSVEKYGYANEPSGRKIMIEYSSPNTNKPLHLGHIRNNLLGWSVSEIQKANGHDVMMVTLVNDRGVHICKSMVAWQHFANGATPESTGIKGDHLVGDYYVAFDKAYKAQIKELMEQGMDEDSAKKSAPIMVEAQEMLRKWEAGDPEVLKLWSMMNGWVLKGFDESYARLGVTFDKTYFESQTYKKGKDTVLKGLADGVLYQKESGSVWCDLTPDGLDHKLLLRDDGTSVYMTQDIGTAQDRFNEFNPDEQIYVVGNEQNYHFQVLKLICGKLGFDWADKITHLSYGMVELPEGKMKSREGTVVDADDLMDDVIATARVMSLEAGKLEGLSEEEAAETFRRVGLAGLKYFILKVDPQKTMLFNPKESIDFNGNTGPFIQYSYARIKSVLRKVETSPVKADINIAIAEKEQELIKSLAKLPAVVKEAGDKYSPAVIANYAYELAKAFNQFYHDFPMLKEEDENLRNFRLLLAANCAKALKSAMGMLGIEMVERM